MSLKDFYYSKYENRELWNYYNLSSSSDPFKNPYEFIKDYFSCGEKSELLEKEIDNFFKKEGNERTQHTVSVFFLGIILKDFLNIDKNDFPPDFRYLWFLTSLYHDIGYFYENQPIKEIETKCLEALDLKEPFLSDTVKKYYSYRIEDFNCMDHGIVGGCKIYEKLNEMLKEAEQKGSHEENGDYNYKGLKWNDNQVATFKKIASAIVRHNIWFCPDTDKIKTYEEKKLQNLIIYRDEQKIKYSKDDGLFFLLVLADTIEPLKSFGNNLDNLERINLKIDGNSIIISCNHSLKGCAKKLFECRWEKWSEKIKDLEKWLQVKVEKNNDKKEIKISLR